ncbi:hypothetical protein QK908_04575 [Lactococcus cremoris]
MTFALGFHPAFNLSGTFKIINLLLRLRTRAKTI